MLDDMTFNKISIGDSEPYTLVIQIYHLQVLVLFLTDATVCNIGFDDLTHP
jgi:hypothetical protein